MQQIRIKINRIISIILSSLLLLGVFMVSPGTGYAAEPTIKKIMLSKEYTSIENPNAYYLTIIGTADSDLNSVPVQYLDKSGKLITLQKSSGGGNIIQFKIDPDKIGATLFVGTQEFNISEMDMGKITSINPRAVKQGEPFKIDGINLDKLNGKDNCVYYYNEVSETEFSKTLDENEFLTINNFGVYSIRFDKQFEDNGADINITYRYVDILRVYDDLDNISDVNAISMYPNRGEKGSKVYFKAEKLKGDISVFFLEKDDGTSPFSQKNKGTNKTYKENAEGALDILTTDVPQGLDAGKEYFVYFTNYVPDSVDPETVIYKQIKLLQKFTVVNVEDKVKILDVEPGSGPDTGTSIEIAGRFFGTLNITGLETNTSLTGESIKFSPERFKLILEYGQGKYDGKDVEDITKTVEVYIGNSAAFEDTSKATTNFTNDMDRIYVKTPSTTIEAEQTIKEKVKVSTVTSFSLDGINFTFQEFDEYDGFIFEATQIKPVIERVLPGKIQVEHNGLNYQIKEPTLMGIYGKEFKIYRETDQNGKTIVRYPIVKIKDNASNEVTINPNEGVILDHNLKPFEDEQGIVKPIMKLFNSNGEELDGSSGKETGVKILITLPKGVLVSEPQPGEAPRDVEVVNPVKNSPVEGLKCVALDIISFVITDKNPVIESVIPDTIPVEGGEQVTITGSNFREGVKIIINGEEVPGTQRSGDGKTITLKAPPGREGETQLQVLNPEGGIAVWPFKYVKTYTDPKITDFSPKSGDTGTLVVVTGQNFLKPDPTSGAIDMLKLIGTRVFLDNKDINTYNLNNYKHIELVNYANETEKLLAVNDKKNLILADYFDSVLLYVDGSSPQQFYTLDKEADGTVKLSDGVNNTYIIEASGDSLKARKTGGSTYNLTIKGNGLTIAEQGIDLIMQTPYEINNGKITGKHVRVINKSEIQFTVPILTADGYYDLKVVNPDTKSDSRTGNQGFYYFSQPQSNPVITKIVPAEGSTLGGYSIEIHGKDFKNDGQKKSRVIINGVEVSPEATEVSKEMISIIVPPYPGDLWKDKGTGSLTVPVVVINTDGASAVKEAGFTYIVPTSNPEIIKVVPTQGSAAGGDIVEITGRDFRFFEPFNDENRDRTWQEGEPYTDLNGNGRWDDFRQHTGAAALHSLYEAEADQEKYADYDSWFERIVRPVLPKVYFNRTPVKVLEFSDGYLKVLSPANPAGKAEVMVVNNDSGVSNKISFTFAGSQPSIDKIIPAEGSKFGRDNVEVYGSGFFPSSIEVYDSLTTIKTKEMPLLRFGAISNREIPRDKDNSGRIDNERTTVKLDGGLTIAYDASQAGNIELNVELNANNKIYTGQFSYDNKVKYIDLSLLSTRTASEAENYSGYELVRVEVQDRCLIVERGYSPSSTLERAGQLMVVTPSYYTVGNVSVTLVNPDGATASSRFTYKNPASSPVISNITRDGNNPEAASVNGQEIRILRMNYQGKSEVAVLGEDFRENARIQIGDILEIKPEAITYTLPTKLTFIMPGVNESQVGKLQRVIVINEDGGIACSDKLAAGQKPIYIQFTRGETSPQIGTVTPAVGPAAGGTVVTITGKDFRKQMEGYADPLAVYFSGAKVAESDVEFIDYKTVQVRTPANSPGSVAVRVENPDGERPVPEGEFTYISTPKITGVESNGAGTSNQNINSISAEGGQEIKVKGSGFMAGCKVVFNPVTQKADAEAKGDIIYKTISRTVGKWQSNELDPYILESGNAGSDVKVLDDQTLIVKTPPGKVDTGGIIIVNPDKGASDPYDGIHYDFPEVQAPLGVTAEILIDEYHDVDHGIKVNWKAVQGAREYEIYVVEDGQVEFIGSTQLTAYVYTDLQRRTTYKFIVKAVGDFGASKPSAESNEVKTGTRVGAPDYDGGISDNTQMHKQGKTALVTLGTKDHNNQPLIVDLTRGDLAGAEEIVLSIPARAIVGRASRDIEIRGSNFSLKMNPAVFGLASVKNNSYRDDAGIRFKIAPAQGSNYFTAANHLSSVYALEAAFFQGENSSPVNYLATNMSLIMDVDNAKVSMRRLTKAAVCRYDEHNSNWMKLEQRKITGGAVPVSIKQLGMYTVIGDRN